MPQEPNRLARLFIPLIVVLLMGGGIFYAVFTNTSKKPAQPATTPTPTAPTTPPAATPAPVATNPSDPQPPAATPSASTTPPPAAATPPAAPTTVPVTPAGLRARAFPFTTGYDPIGSLTPKEQGGQFEMEVRFTPVGSGIDRLAFSNIYYDPLKTSPEILQSFRPVKGSQDPRAGLAAMAANRVEINGAWVALCDTGNSATAFWRQIDSKPGHFEAIIDDTDGKEFAKVTRIFDLKPASHEIELRQAVENLSGAPMTIRWEQFGPVSPPVGPMRYGGDVRRIRFGYTWPPAQDPERTILADDRAASMILHHDAVGERINGQWQAKTLWANDDSRKLDLSLAWAGITNRYFGVAIYPLIPATPATPAGKGDARLFNLAAQIDRYAVDTAEPEADKLIADIALVTTSAPISIAPGQSGDVSMGIYAGPASREVVEKTAPLAAAQSIQEIVIYTLGGPCAFCTFQWLTGPLHSLLALLHALTRDWAISIILLVVCVRTVLHPVTRWTQRRMLFFSKEMAKIAPKMKAIQDRYKDDPAKLREEQTRMMGEHGGVYASGALGCLPAFLQTPIWIALSSMIGFAYELRNTPAFFGVFQSIAPKWSFLADLGSPDNLIAFGASFHIWGISALMGPIDGINLMPILLGVVFYIQQKYLTPPATTPLTPEQEQQQKIMKVMTVVLFPLMMYNTPAGLTLYFTANSTLAIIESKLIRAKAEEEWKEREAVKAAKLAAGIHEVGTSIWDRKGAKVAKPQGLFARLRQAAEQAQKMREESQKRSKKGKK